MNKFNQAIRNLTKDRRTRRAHLRRQKHGGDSLRLPTKNSNQPLSVSGKKQRKQLKKWRRAQKAALETGLVTMQDIVMVESESHPLNNLLAKIELHNAKEHQGVTLKKRAKVHLKMRKTKGNQLTSSSISTAAAEDTEMRE